MEIKENTGKSIPVTFKEIALKRGDQIAIRHKDFGLWQEISWEEYYLQSSYLAHGLMELGIKHGDFVGIIGENCPEWLYMDMGIQMAGARTVGIYTTSAWKQVQYILDHSECRILFAENEEQVDKWLQMRESLNKLEYVIYWDKKGLERLNDRQLIYYDDFILKGKNSFEKQPELHIDRMNKVDPKEIAILVYTSGTTGRPKGAMITGENLLWVANSLENEEIKIIDQRDNTMSFLPMCHVFERMFSVYAPMILGNIINIAESPDTIAQNIREIRPTVGLLYQESGKNSNPECF
jgi:long-chain acyl-CoA synthetase